jgi:hypothetical protein
MRTPEDPCRDPASEARDDWEDREPNDWRRRDRDLADTEEHERWVQEQQEGKEVSHDRPRESTTTD